MKEERPIKIRRGCTHQLSSREVSPNCDLTRGTSMCAMEAPQKEQLAYRIADGGVNCDAAFWRACAQMAPGEKRSSGRCILYIMRRTQLYLEEDAWKALHVRSKISGLSISELVRQAIR